MHDLTTLMCCPPVRDTSPKQAARYIELLRSLEPHQRLAIAMSLNRSVRDLAIAGIRAQHPNGDDDEVRVRLTVCIHGRLYGRAAAERLFKHVPDDAR